MLSLDCVCCKLSAVMILQSQEFVQSVSANVRRLILWPWNCLWWTDFWGTVRLIDLRCFALNKRAYSALDLILLIQAQR